MTPQEFDRLRHSFEYYAPLLHVRLFNPQASDAISPMGPLRLGNIQIAINNSIIRQAQLTGKVRKIILKARRHQVSTYCIARMFWHTHLHPGVAAFCLTHHGDTTEELFDMTTHFKNRMLPSAMFATGKDAAKGYSHPAISSHMKVSTAGSATVGHGFAITHFLGSEVSRWPNAKEHISGVMQAVANVQGTEIILESVGGKRGGLWHQMWEAAVRGDSEFEPLFFPWYAHHEYYQDDISEWLDSATQEDRELQKLWDLSDQQMAWRLTKLKDFVGEDRLLHFGSMYPATMDEAFVRFGGSFISVGLVRAARKAEYNPLGPKIMGVDFGGGKDRTSKIMRRGRVAYGLENTLQKDPMSLAGWIAKRIDSEKPAAIFLDESGASVGAAIGSRLRELGYKNVIGVQFGGSADEGDKYKNKRVEMWARAKDWLTQGAEIPNVEELEADLTAPDEIEPDTMNRLRLQSKQDMRKEGLPSPDTADALALTFAYPVKGDVPEEKIVTDEMLAHQSAMASSRNAHQGGLLRVNVG